jgi:DNA-binding transcriptional LysR family regulator
MRSLNLDQLQTLIAIADLGTFAAAAQALHLSPPTVSLHISELESRLGTVLLERGHRRARLTSAGAALVEQGRCLLKGADEAIDQVRRIAEGREGRVRLGTSTGVVVHLLPRVLEALERRSPGIDVELDILGSGETMSRLNAGTLDIGIVALPQAPSAEVQVSAWRSDPMMAYLPPRWEAPEAVTPEWLSQRALISNDSTTLMYRLTAEWFGQAGLTPRARIELNYTEAMKSLVAAGYGAAVLPLERPNDAELHARMQLRPLNPPLTRHLGIVHRAPELLDAATREVLRAVTEFGQE